MLTNIAKAPEKSKTHSAELLKHVSMSDGLPRLKLTDYAHLPLLDILHSYLQRVLASPRVGVNILLYGCRAPEKPN